MQYPGKVITDTYPSLMLCGKRYDNNMPFASSSSGLPHTCFEDTVLVPLASWIFLVALIGHIAYALSLSRRADRLDGKMAWHRLVYRKQNAQHTDAALLESSQGRESHQKVPGGAPLTGFGLKHPTLATTLSIIYSLLILATLLMNILEIVRLYLADRGAGLLPFSLASITIILVLMHLPLPPSLRPVTGGVILLYWVFSLIFTSIQIATLSKLLNVESRAETEYLDSDQILDVGVMLGLYGLAIIVESVRIVLFFARSSK